MKVILIPIYGHAVSAGFPSPADDFIDEEIDLLKKLIEQPSSTFIARVVGLSQINVGLFPGDLLIVERHIKPKNGSLVIAALDGDLTCKTIDTERQLLLPANDTMQPIPIGNSELVIEGVVRRWIRCHVPLG
ncbi:MAG: translesion error-prone DNA polymerase V autoproteolytic subunit [Oceanicoccus sp.]|uniref:LexA family protein n=1 Tax=Oceanicoccus sp. TaxID=2691044 RepID=UPI00260A43AB|nr:translesion error-prone DNA polymerase V autoproteolytic subunit [Oceanicoccus sp.]MCP3907685.1 translesion error-prone DNA polymerase V autoproteolytic subunit [Oceanicoccus sp.]MDG1773718.1 translesion error-prone DNA polymerase V autoproteolytic subunit [Oceanicoccus sp.]